MPHSVLSRRAGRHRGQFRVTRWAGQHLPVVSVLAVAAGAVAASLLRNLLA